MSKSKSSIEERYHAVMQAKQGVPLLRLQKMYSISPETIKSLIRRYDKEGMEGLKDRMISYYPERTKLSILHDYEANHLSLVEIEKKYDIAPTTFKRWIPLYEAYKKGDRFALSGGKVVHKEDLMYPVFIDSIPSPQRDMQESKERAERRKALSKLNKKELRELLLDTECELDILKKLEALDQERENRRHAIWHKSSKD